MKVRRKHFFSSVLCNGYCLITHLAIFFLNIFVVDILISLSENPNNFIIYASVPIACCFFLGSDSYFFELMSEMTYEKITEFLRG